METVVPAGVALTAIGLAMNDKRHDVSAGTPPLMTSGVLSGLISVNNLLGAGWKIHGGGGGFGGGGGGFGGAPSTRTSDLDPGKGAWVLIGATDEHAENGHLVLAAAARRKDVFKKTSGSTTHLANGVYWYNSCHAFGFSGHPTIQLDNGQDVCDEEGESRLSISSQWDLTRVGMRKIDAYNDDGLLNTIVMYFDGTGQGGEQATEREWVLGERVSLVKAASGQVFGATRLDGTPCQVPAHALKTPTVVEKGRNKLEGKWCISANVNGPITCVRHARTHALHAGIAL
jgi:hypothetical protein